MKLFVYGSLRKGMYNYDLYLKNQSEFVSEAYVCGKLYSLKGKKYPAMIEGNDQILGEIFEVNEEVATAIDAMENYVPGDINNEYDRIDTDILDAQGNVITNLPIYWYNTKREGSVELLDEIVSDGDWTKYFLNNLK